MALERIILNIIPAGDMPVFHCSQYENGRSVIIDLVSSDDDAYIVPEGVTVELHCRKCDDTIITMEPDEVDNNTVTFVTSEQLTACPGDNLCELVLYSDTDPVQTLATLNFILHVEPDPLAGGLTSDSDIYNLTQQIEDITQEVIGEDYYNKTETDALLANKANSNSVYTKGETDALLADKANSSDVYTKGETDTLLSAKADSDDVYTKSETYTQAEVNALIDNIFPTLTASGAIATFTTALAKPLVSVTADVSATTITACGVNLWDEVWEQGYYNASGNPIPDTNAVRSKNYIRVKPSSSVYWYNGTDSYGRIQFYDENQEWFNTDTNSNRVINIPANCYYIKISTGTAYGGTYKNDLSILYPSDTTPAYHSYSGQTVSVADATTLVTQSGVNNVYADSGNVTVQYKYMSM